MSDFNWCHGPNCHTYETQSRVRGSGRDKVLRTRKVKIHYSNNNEYLYTWYNFFCDNRCLMDYLRKHMQSVMAHEPRTQPLELPVNITKTTETNWSGNNYTRTNIERVDNSGG